MRNVVCFGALLVALATPLARADEPPRPPAPDADLSFREFFEMPVGPRGLVPSARLLALDGRRVRIAGYMARQDEAPPGLVIMAALPVTLGDEDERYADDLPAAALYVQLAPAEQARVVPHLGGRLQLSGVLHVGARRQADGRWSFVQLELDPALSRELARPASP